MSKNEHLQPKTSIKSTYTGVDITLYKFDSINNTVWPYTCDYNSIYYMDYEGNLNFKFPDNVLLTISSNKQKRKAELKCPKLNLFDTGLENKFNIVVIVMDFKTGRGIISFKNNIKNNIYNVCNIHLYPENQNDNAKGFVKITRGGRNVWTFPGKTNI